MIYPVGDGTKTDFLQNWYVADGFGSFRVVGNFSYYHSGADINLRTGGDSDLGQPIKAISSGKMVYYHRNSHPTRSYGRHNVYKISGEWGVRWVHPAHCMDKDFVGEVKDLLEGDLTGRIGKSGTRWGHLHLSVFRVDPASLRNGIDTIAKTPNELDNWWEDPIQFINKYYGASMPDLPPDFGDTVWKSTQHDETVKYIWGEDANPREKSSKDVQQYIGGLKSQITTLQNRCAEKEAIIKTQKEQISTLEDRVASKEKENLDLQTAYNNIVREINDLRVSSNAQIKVLEESIDQHILDKTALNEQIAVLETKLKNCQAGNNVGCWSIFIENIKKLFRR